jgi:hypothetical protein
MRQISMMQWWNDTDRAKLKYSLLRITASLLSVNCDSAFKLKHQENIIMKT